MEERFKNNIRLAQYCQKSSSKEASDYNTFLEYNRYRVKIYNKNALYDYSDLDMSLIHSYSSITKATDTTLYVNRLQLIRILQYIRNSDILTLRYSRGRYRIFMNHSDLTRILLCL